ncbi:acyltransferase [Mucilaginibacter sp.]|uniref:acyltransferase family protein n=1 Tax=Mucilaginibacter sp. TaxID=1882438 RepID=UPI002615B228|nr:acyltransferase [Mucilaginibacter sp.]MDB4921447.1 Acyltransferase family protein [Mucilaginibacter sp.]
MSKIEIKSLTGIRGIAALYVIMFHWYNHLSQKQTVFSSSQMDQLFTNFLKHGYLSVDLFFALSGFVLCVASYNLFSEQIAVQDYKKFIYKRFFRLFPVYICLTLLYYVVFGGSKVIDLLINLTLFQGIVPSHSGSIIPPGWSLTNEWVVCFVFPFLLFYGLKIKRKVWLLVIIALLLLLLISIVRGYAINWGSYSFFKKINGFYPIVGYTRGPASLLRTIAAFLLGIFAFIIYRFQNKGSYLKYLKYLIIPSFALLFISNSDILIILLLPVLILYITQANFLNRFLSSKPVHFAGLISYSLYLNHFLFINTYDSVLAFVKINNDLFSLSYILVSTFIFSTVTYYVIEKPGIALYKYRLKYKAVNNKNLPHEKNGAPVNPETLQETILTSRNTKE